MAMTLRQHQWCLSVFIARLQFQIVLFAQYANTCHVARQTGQVQRRRSKVIRFLQINAGVHEQSHQIGMTFVGGPM